MALLIGDEDANTGMTKAIYDEIRALLEDELRSQGLDEAKLAPIRTSWKKLSHAVARGVIEHMVTNMEVFGVTVEGDIPGIANNVVLTQNNDGVGRIR